MLPYFLANLLVIPLGTLYQNYLVCKSATVPHAKLYMLACTGGSTVLWIVNNYVLTPSVAVDIAVIVILLATSFLFASKGSRLRALLTMTVLLGVELVVYFLLGLIAFPIAETLGYEAADLINKTSSYGNAVMALICLVVSVPPMYFSYVFLKKFLISPKLSPWVLLFLPIPISQGIMVNLMSHLIPMAGGLGNLVVGFILAITFSVIADITFFVGIRKVQRGEQLKQQVSLAEEQMNIQASYYRQMQDNILAVNQIRHDLSNQLQAAYYLLEQGEKSQVRQQLDQLKNEIQDKVGPQYCANLMVDAVLTDKARACREQGISLSIQAELPLDIPIESSHLCSAFSNLLDNSIQGVLNCYAGEKRIELRTMVRSNCLIIRCVNSANAPVQKQSTDSLRLHGLGLGILERLAHQYHGSLDTVYHDGKFDATLTLSFS